MKINYPHPHQHLLLAVLLLKKNSFLAVLGLHCCEQAFSSYGEQGLLLTEGPELLLVEASPVAEHRL